MDVDMLKEVASSKCSHSVVENIICRWKLWSGKRSFCRRKRWCHKPQGRARANDSQALNAQHKHF